MGKLTLILGGARSGKSTLAERLAAARGRRVTTIATAQALDEEMEARIRAHREKRPAGWRTLEVPHGVAGALRGQEGQAEVVLLDCLTLLVSNLLLQSCAQGEIPGAGAAREAVEAEVAGLLGAIGEGEAQWIVVSNEVGMGLVPPYPLGREFRDLLGWANQRLAAAAGEVYLLVAGMPIPLHALSDQGLLASAPVDPASPKRMEIS